MVDKTSLTPIYSQLKEMVREKIEAGVWPPGTLIPSERDFCEQFGISRMTVRQALGELVSEGMVVREKGKGTFVAQPRLRQRLTRLTGFSEDMLARGKQPGARVLRVERVAAKPPAARALGILPGEEVILIERLRLADGEPVALEASHLHFEGVERVLSLPLDGSLYRLLTETFDIHPKRAQQEIEATLATAREMDLLKLETDAPVLRNRRTTYDAEGRPFEYAESVYRGDRYTFYAELNNA
ncbi:MAG: GntR family transcriptional regulator [Anaerolineae bacterium]|nr:GntR family transcriptional regulator [Anaerolineae bacterium]